MYQLNRKSLYHGTISNIDTIDVNQGRDRKDFGKGFYIAETKAQAIGMMHKKYKEAVHRNRNKRNVNINEYLYEIFLDWEYVETLNIKIFDYADETWLDFILECRERGGIPHNYDIVIGPTADDDTMFCLKAYWDGLYGKTGTLSAKKILLSNLEPENLGIQYYIGKQEIADRAIKQIKAIDWRR